MDFSGKAALVTGSSSGIGAAIARELAAKGASIAVHYRGNADGAEAVAEDVRQLGAVCTLYQADLSDVQQATDLVKYVQGELGGLDILVNNAGTTRDKLLMTMSEDDWDAVMASQSAECLCRHTGCPAWHDSQARGRIINVTSVVGLIGQAGQANYAASKAGIIGFTKSLAREVASRNVTVNAVAPGFIPTALTDVLTEEQHEENCAKHANGANGYA